jgi:hypothetical protein
VKENDMALPQDPQTYPVMTSGQPVVEPLVLTPEETAEVDALYLELKPEATEAARSYVLARTPAKYQVDMAAKIEADWPAPPI